MNTDARTVLAVVVLLGTVTLLGLAGLIWLADHDADAALLAVIAGPTGVALGALSGLLATTRTVDEGAIAKAARDEALADVAALSPVEET